MERIFINYKIHKRQIKLILIISETCDVFHSFTGLIKDKFISKIYFVQLLIHIY